MNTLMIDPIPSSIDANLLAQFNQKLELTWRDLMSQPVSSSTKENVLHIDGIGTVAVEDEQFILTPVRQGTWYDLPAAIGEFRTYSAAAAHVKALAWMLLTMDEMC